MVDELISRVDVAARELRIEVSLQRLVGGQSSDDSQASWLMHWLTVPARLTRRTREVRLIVPPARDDQPRKDAGLIRLLVRAHQVRKAFDQSESGLAELAISCGYDRDYLTVLLKLSYLAPDIVAAILDGRHPQELTRQRLARIRQLPFAWRATAAAWGSMFRIVIRCCGSCHSVAALRQYRSKEHRVPAAESR